MKSLEIVNERIEDLESRLESANYLAKGNPSEFGKTIIGDLSKHLDSCKQIKQDLEVLEILKKKEVNINEEITGNTYDEYYEEFADLYDSYMLLTEEEFNKLKQWLEEK